MSARFDDVVQVFTRSFGNGARVLVYKTMTELYKEYSLRADFAFWDSMKDKIVLLKERFVSDLLRPTRHFTIDDSIYPPAFNDIKIEATQ